jgi:hypothetical protein
MRTAHEFARVDSSDSRTSDASRSDGGRSQLVRDGDPHALQQVVPLAGVVAANAALAGELTASLAGNDPVPLTAVQTSHGTDLAVASLTDRGTVTYLRRWLDDGDDPVLRVNAAGIMAKLPGQYEASRVAAALRRDKAVRSRYMTAVISRICGVDWLSAAHLAASPTAFPQPGLAAQQLRGSPLVLRSHTAIA